MKKPTFHIGCSSYYNGYWKGIFYPEDLPRSRWFEFYSAHFNTYELNGTFYKFPTLRVLQNWYKKAPDGFIFSVKAPKIITHIKRFSECETEVVDFYEVCRAGLQDKLGCVLFQLPPGFHYSAENLQMILNVMNADFKNVVEFRHESWWRQEVFDAFSALDITFCNVNYPKLPTEIVTTAPIGYLRLHGNPKLFFSEYTKAELDLIFEGFNKSNFETIYIYFNNTAGTAGILNAVTMAAIS